MKIIIFEACRSPHIKKQTETIILSRYFDRHNIQYTCYSNDHIWPNPVIIDKNFITQHLLEDSPDIVHLATHGDDYGFVLKWSYTNHVGRHTPEDRLIAADILQMSEWQGKLIVSGACSSATLAPYFLDAGATGIIAPTVPIDWPNLGQFFTTFYKALFSGKGANSALQHAISEHPEYSCYQLHSPSE